MLSVYTGSRWFLFGSLSRSGSFSLSSFLASAQLKSHSVMDRRDFEKTKQNPYVLSWAIRCVLECFSKRFLVYVRLMAFFKFFFFFSSYLSIQPFVTFSLFSYFIPKFCCFFYIRLLLYSCAFSIDLVEFSFVIFEGSCFVCISSPCLSIF